MQHHHRFLAAAVMQHQFLTQRFQTKGRSFLSHGFIPRQGKDKMGPRKPASSISISSLEGKSTGLKRAERLL